jgi:thiol-disulfide isomerase/thioredoxin
MPSNPIPFLLEGKIFFPEGEFDLENGTLQEMEKLLGCGSYIDCELPAGKKIRSFDYPAGKVSVYFHPDEQVNSQSNVVAVDFFPSDVVFLFQFFGFYEQDCRQTPCIPIEDETEEKYLAVFSPNLLFCFCRDQDVVETISFLSTKHVTTCQCEICGVIRQVTANPSFIQRRSQKETVH